MAAIALLASAALVVIALTVDVGPTRPGPEQDGTTAETEKTKKRILAGPIGQQKPGYTLVGGVWRPSTDVKPAVKREKKPNHNVPRNYGKAERIPVDANPQVASVAESLRTGKHPERVSALLTPKPFDDEVYAVDPQSYLQTIEPGRVWQSAQPGPGVPQLKQLTGRFHAITQGESVVLAVKVEPKSPVTFTSFDMGEFENRLTSITVAADGEGVAHARFTGSSGTLDDVKILAASPTASGQAKFVVNVQEPVARPLAGAGGA